MARAFAALRYDLRCPDFAKVSRGDLYSTFLEQAKYADTHGIDMLVLSEHHSVEDGYLPSPLPLAAAAAAVTERVPIFVAALLLPLYDPIRLAEDMVVVDHVAKGRVSYVCGLGYRPEEYELFGADWKRRGKSIEESILTIQAAWTGEPFEYEGRTVKVTPKPYTRSGVPLLYGGGSPAAARRAARLGLMFYPQNANEDLIAVYDEEQRRVGGRPGMVIRPPSRTGTFFVAEDPDKFWADHGHHLLYEATEYAKWQVGLESAVFDTSTSIEEMRAAGTYRVVSPDEMVEVIREGPSEPLTFHPLIGGLDPEVSWECLKLLAENVLPRARAKD